MSFITFPVWKRNEQNLLSGFVNMTFVLFFLVSAVDAVTVVA